MPWKEHGVMEERLRFVAEWESGDWSMTELCRFYGVAWGTGYKWVARYEIEGLNGLRDLSRAPHRHPNEISSEMEDLVIAMKEQVPELGCAEDSRQADAHAAGEKNPGGEHNRSDPEATWINGVPEAATHLPAGEPTVGARRSAQCGLVRRLQGMVSNGGRKRVSTR